MSFDERGLALVIAGAVPKHVIMLPAEVRAVARRILEVFGPRLVERATASVSVLPATETPGRLEDGTRVRVTSGPCQGRLGVVYDQEWRESKVRLDGDVAGEWFPNDALEVCPSEPEKCGWCHFDSHGETSCGDAYAQRTSEARPGPLCPGCGWPHTPQQSHAESCPIANGDGARCHRCGHYETSYERATSLYAHCPSCSRHTRWLRVASAQRTNEALSPGLDPGDAWALDAHGKSLLQKLPMTTTEAWETIIAEHFLVVFERGRTAGTEEERIRARTETPEPERVCDDLFFAGRNLAREVERLIKHDDNRLGDRIRYALKIYREHDPDVLRDLIAMAEATETGSVEPEPTCRHCGQPEKAHRIKVDGWLEDVVCPDGQKHASFEAVPKRSETK